MKKDDFDKITFDLMKYLTLLLGESNLDCEEEGRRQNDAITVCQFLCAKLDEGVK